MSNKTLTFDMQTHLCSREEPSGTKGQISFTRLIEELYKTGEIHDYEKVTHLTFDIAGETIRYTVTTKS